MELSVQHENVVRRFVAACREDKRVVACALGGSNARGEADSYSDLDIDLITTDEAHENFYGEREKFISLLGEPLFVENFDLKNIVFFVLGDGTEGELGIGRESETEHFHWGPYQVLLDKKGALTGNVIEEKKLPESEQIEKLRRLIYWFWHDLSHFITAMGRGQLWWGYGQLQMLRGYCVNLARMEKDLFDAEAGEDPYWKLEKSLPVERFDSLQNTFCPMERGAMLESARTILNFYLELAVPLAQKYEIEYPAKLERIVVERLEKLERADG